MITLTSDNFTVEFGSKIMFNWSYNPVTVNFLPDGSDNLEYIDLTVSDVNGNGGITFRRYFPKNNVVTFDISRALQALRQTEVKLTVTDAPGNELSSFIYCINGNNGAIEHFGAGTRQIRIWEGIEAVLPFYYSGFANIIARRKDTREVLLGQFSASTKTGYGYAQVAVSSIADIDFIYMQQTGIEFDGTGWQTNATWRYNVVPGCKPTGESLYLRWTDRQGLRWFWLFRVNEKITATEKSVEYGKIPNIGAGVLLNEFSEEAAKKITRRARIGTYQVVEDEYKVVSTLYTSVLVDAYDTEAKRWYRVKVLPGEMTEPKGNYRDVEFEVEFASETTQLP